MEVVINTLLEQRIVKLAFTPIAELPEELKRLGLHSELYEDGNSLRIDGQIRVGLHESDPITKAVQLGFAICGTSWSSILPGLLQSVDKEWKRRAATTTTYT